MVSFVKQLANVFLHDPEVVSTEVDRKNYIELLGDLYPQPELVEALAAAGITSLADIRKDNGKALRDVLRNAPESARGTAHRIARTLNAQARLAPISSDIALNQTLSGAGLTRVSRIARLREHELLSRVKADPVALRELHQRATVLRAASDVTFLDAVISRIPANVVPNFIMAASIPAPIFRLAAPTAAPDACRLCDNCLSGLSPAAYLVDLIDFVIDNFSAPATTTSGIAPIYFTTIADLDARFRRTFTGLVVRCDQLDEPVRQIEIAIQVLETFITTPPVTGYGRNLVYGFFTLLDARGRPVYPKPDILSRMFDAYLNEMSVTRADFDTAIQAAYPAAGAANMAALNVILNHLGVTEATLRNNLALGANWTPTIQALDWMPTLVTTFKTKGLNVNNLQQLTLYQDAVSQAEASISRVKEYALPDIRANLIAFALRELTRAQIPAELSAIKNARQLGNYLHTELSASACMMTTWIANSIEAIQSFIFAFQSGREEPGYFLSFQGGTTTGNFEARWRWLRSFSLWHAAQSVLLYPENFLIPNIRQSKTAAFTTLLTTLDGLNSADEAAIDRAVQAYRQAALNLWAANGIQFEPLPGSPQGIGLAAFQQRQSVDYLRQAQLRQMNSQFDVLRVYLDEWYFYLPLAVANYLNGTGHFEQAATWFHNVFFPFAAQVPPGVPFPPVRLVWWGFSEVRDQSYLYRNTVEWLSNPFEPFAVARTRQGAFVRHVIIRYVENLLDWADADFSRDNIESISRARELYELAEDILVAGEVPQEEACRTALRELYGYILATFNAENVRLLQLIITPVQMAGERLRLADIVAMTSTLQSSDPLANRLTNLKQLVDAIVARPVPSKTLNEIIQEQQECQIPELVESAYGSVIGSPAFPRPSWPTINVSPELRVIEFTLRKIGCGFCVPPNPLIETLRYRIETNLEKIRTCRNIEGMQRSLATYATPANPTAIIQAVAGGYDIEEAIPAEPPSVFRFSYLIERARYYVQVAQTLENQLLEAFKAGDDARYNEMKAQQDLAIAKSNLALQVLRVKEAFDNIELSKLQTARSRFQDQHYRDLIRGDWLPFERQALTSLWAAHNFAYAATITGSVGAIVSAIGGAIFGAYVGNAPGAVAGAIIGGIGGVIGGGGQLFQGISNVNSIYSQARAMEATYQRRAQEWQLQQGLAQRDIRIGEQGITIANDRHSITEQERNTADLQSQFATEVVNFLAAKFLKKDLWDWMSRVLRRYYREHLNFATVMARLAQNALAFERQESLTIIAPYYSDSTRRDLMAAEQLLTDINRLDQHRLITQKRAKELTKTISLASIAPSEFEQLRQQGWMEFYTLMAWFDRDFPGHYMRLIKSVSVTVIGLIPAGETIRATLSNNGISSVMVGPPFSVFKEVQRQPESIALSTASNGTGLFELSLEDPILLPFEGSGVATAWTLQMPKGANRFDFSTLTDVLLTIRYTAHDDATNREKVLTAMGLDANRMVSVESTNSLLLSNAYPDGWYHLHNPIIRADGVYGYGPGQTLPPYELQFEVRRQDFPPNETALLMKTVNLALRQTHFVEVPLQLEFDSGGQRYAVQMDYQWNIANAASGPLRLTAFTQQWNAAQQVWNAVNTPISTLSPLGTWRLRLRQDANRGNQRYAEFFRNSTATRLDLSWLMDALLAISYDAKVEYRYG